MCVCICVYRECSEYVNCTMSVHTTCFSRGIYEYVAVKLVLTWTALLLLRSMRPFNHDYWLKNNDCVLWIWAQNFPHFYFLISEACLNQRKYPTNVHTHYPSPNITVKEVAADSTCSASRAALKLGVLHHFTIYSYYSNMPFLSTLCYVNFFLYELCVSLDSIGYLFTGSKFGNFSGKSPYFRPSSNFCLTPLS